MNNGNNKLKVLFIAGNGRSGSTILENILGQVEGFSSWGELREMWERGFVKNKLCACERPFHECDVWKAVIEEAYGGPENIDARRMSADTESFRLQHMPSALIPTVKKHHAARLEEYLANLEKLYRAMQVTTGSRIIIDGSKNPSYGYLVSMIPEIELHILHLVRDSRAVAYSWSKRKLFQPGDYMARKTPAQSAMQWNARNALTEMFLNANAKDHMLLRYEDYVRYPQEAIARIMDFMGESSAQLPFVSENEVLLSTNHSVFGNAVRYQTGTVKLRLDMAWRKKFAKSRQRTVMALTWPLMLKYGYLSNGSH